MADLDPIGAPRPIHSNDPNRKQRTEPRRKRTPDEKRGTQKKDSDDDRGRRVDEFV